MVAAMKVAIVPHAQSQKVQALTRFMQLDVTRFLSTNGEPESSF